MARRFLVKYQRVVQFMLFLFGMILILVSNMVQSGSEPNLLLFSLGTSFLASTLLSLLDSFFGTDTPTLLEEKLDFKKRVYDLGLEAVSMTGDLSFFDHLDQARSLDLMYTTAKATSHHFGQAMMKAIELHGCKVRLLISHPKNNIWKDPDACYALALGIDTVNEIKDTLAYFTFLVDDVKQKSSVKSGSFEIRMYPCLPTSSITIIDGKICRHIPYLPYSNVADSPKYDITKERDGKLFLLYQTTFERVWKKSEVLLKVEWPLSPHP